MQLLVARLDTPQDLEEPYFNFQKKIPYVRVGLSLLTVRICIDHFESTYLSLCKERVRLNYSINPIPTIHPTSIAKSQSVIPIRVRKSPKLRVFQKDELSLFKDKYTVINKGNVVSYMKVADECRNFHVDVSEFGVTAYRVKIDSGIAVVQECVHVTNDLHVILSF